MNNFCVRALQKHANIMARIISVIPIAEALFHLVQEFKNCEVLKTIDLD